MAEPYSFQKSEQPAMPGGPYTPGHPIGRKVGYALTAVSLAVFGPFANALLSSNLAYVADGLGLTNAEASWLTVAIVGMGAGANLFVIKTRIQFGIPSSRRATIGYAMRKARIRALQGAA